ncbi:hypothetical protein [Amycolatopsis granulosa]|uniref:hypothetical protein n=1 Tax=Amycolatopsis granulosa TaxID=185684 RepID=UPI001423FA21|nr:hypothetical protein [Amycolatopsis granulosa]NIH88313.1 hypothetical protein [Amycolatopsis granulosa]
MTDIADQPTSTARQRMPGIPLPATDEDRARPGDSEEAWERRLRQMAIEAGEFVRILDLRRRDVRARPGISTARLAALDEAAAAAEDLACSVHRAAALLQDELDTDFSTLRAPGPPRSPN